MHNIDFLPAECRQQQARRQVQPWRFVVVTAFAVLLAGAAYAQYRQKRVAEDQLAALAPACEEAARQGDRLKQLQQDLQAVQSDAELFTYLRHPWPRTQVLAALLGPLPREITLQQLQLAREAVAEQPAVDPRPPADQKAEEEKLAKLPPADRDLRRLRGEFDKTRAMLRITGTTSDTAALHHYLNVLGRTDLFSKATVRSIETVEGPKGQLTRFQAIVFVRAGYGQPGGPVGPELKAVAQTNKAEGSGFGVQRSAFEEERAYRPLTTDH
jgi:Tfp pilus assembly protein PilN